MRYFNTKSVIAGTLSVICVLSFSSCGSSSSSQNSSEVTTTSAATTVTTVARIDEPAGNDEPSKWAEYISDSYVKIIDYTQTASEKEGKYNITICASADLATNPELTVKNLFKQSKLIFRQFKKCGALDVLSVSFAAEKDNDKPYMSYVISSDTLNEQNFDDSNWDEYSIPKITENFTADDTLEDYVKSESERKADDLADSFTDYLSTFYQSVEVSYDYDKDYFTASALVKNGNELLNSANSVDWSNFVDGVVQKYESMRDTVQAKGLNSKLKISLYSDYDNSEMVTVKGNIITYNARKDEYTSYLPQNNSAKPASSSESSVSTGKKNALRKANEYLDYMAFSYSGLIDQLKYEGFSESEAEYGADNCGADWNEQAEKKAKEYLDFMAFSYDGLVEQLEYEGFTHSQAVHGADSVY